MQQEKLLSCELQGAEKDVLKLEEQMSVINLQGL